MNPDLLLFILVIASNLLGGFIKIRPIRLKYFHLSHHFLYFFVMAAAMYSSTAAYFFHEKINYYSIGVFLILTPLSFFKKGKKVHIILGVTALLLSGLGYYFS
ncbi:MAG: hypothetical protein K8R21_14595 [Leptospira sp.]|nr:hypothetical protein [Leptospira sp.]